MIFTGEIWSIQYCLNYDYYLHMQTLKCDRKKFIHSVRNHFPPTVLRRRHAQTVRDSSSSYKNSHSDQVLSKSWRASKSHQWFKSYSHFTEGVDFAYWWSFSGGGSAINGATPSSFIYTIFGRQPICPLFHVTDIDFVLYKGMLTQLWAGPN